MFIIPKKKTLAHLSLHVGMYIYYRYTAVDIVFVFIQLGRKLAGSIICAF